MKKLTTILIATAVLFMSSFAGASPHEEWTQASSGEAFDFELLSDADLLAVTGTGLFKDVACGVANGLTFSSVVVGVGAAILSTAVPPVGVAVMAVSGVGSFICLF